jgi:subtilisin family serine protease
MNAFEMVALSRLMQLTIGRPEIVIGLIDGPVFMKEGTGWSKNVVQHASSGVHSTCARPSSAACVHGTFVASVLASTRGGSAPAICPGCTLLLHSIFPETVSGDESMPSASPDQLAAAIVALVNAGARVLNMSIGLFQPASKDERSLKNALDYAATRGTIPVVASGNQGTVGSSTLTRHPCVIPVVACDGNGRPTAESNLGNSIGRRGLRAPGTNITGLGPDGRSRSLGGTSVATPFVTGTLALLWSQFPAASANDLRFATRQPLNNSRAALVPPLLNAWAAYESLDGARRRPDA